MDTVPRRPVNRQALIDVNLKVSSLVGTSGTWNLELLMDFFRLNEVDRIKSMVPGTVKDCFIWAHSKHGAYTVKTGYGMLAKAKTAAAGQISPQEQVRFDLRKRVWKIPTLPKIRMFLWRALSSALAVAERLKSRGMGVEPNCKICHGSTENINHVLFQFSAALQLWSGAGFTLPSFVMAHSLEENFSYVFNLMEDSNRPQSLIRTIPWMLWLIWKNMNSILYADTQESMERLLRDMGIVEFKRSWSAKGDHCY
ncbi:hypothetical protein Bca52824_051915 [Brassica carinata]|uniref:Reverse transcriptase zinc-binding domain-containing protein n=1 Tax=Brassica carinata TaxID=52824 RepID=A0A8X7UI77_BRACI|nr:hypothetical protein Bca52824_051915 [Brassica carinata]